MSQTFSDFDGVRIEGIGNTEGKIHLDISNRAIYLDTSNSEDGRKCLFRGAGWGTGIDSEAKKFLWVNEEGKIATQDCLKVNEVEWQGEPRVCIHPTSDTNVSLGFDSQTEFLTVSTKFLTASEGVYTPYVETEDLYATKVETESVVGTSISTGELNYINLGSNGITRLGNIYILDPNMFNDIYEQLGTTKKDKFGDPYYLYLGYNKTPDLVWFTVQRGNRIRIRVYYTNFSAWIYNITEQYFGRVKKDSGSIFEPSETSCNPKLYSVKAVKYPTDSANNYANEIVFKGGLTAPFSDSDGYYRFQVDSSHGFDSSAVYSQGDVFSDVLIDFAYDLRYPWSL